MKFLSDWPNNFIFIRERFKRYWAVLVWLLLDLWQFGRHRLLIMLSASFLSKTLLSSVFILLFLYLRALEKGKASWLIYLPEGMAISDLFWPVAIAGSVFFIFSSLLDIIVLQQVLDISARHGVDVSRRCLSKFFPILPDLKGMGSKPFPADTIYLSTGGTDILSRATRTLLRSVPSVFQFLYGTILLVLIDPLTVITVALIAIPGLGFSYLLNSRILENEYKLPGLIKERKDLAISQAKIMARQKIPPDEQVILNFDNKLPLFHEVQTMRSDRVLNRQRSDTLTNLIIGVALLAVLGQLGYGALTGEREWTVVITFIALLRHTGNSLGKILSSFAFFSRLYLKILRYPLYLGYPGFLPSGNKLKSTEIKNSLRVGDLQKIQVRSGKTYHIFSKTPLTPLNLWFFVYCLSNNKLLRAKDLLEKTVFFDNESAFETYAQDNIKSKGTLLLLQFKLWHKISKEVVSKFPDATIAVCYVNVPKGRINKDNDKDTWILPAANGQMGLCTSDWLLKHLDEIETTLSKKNISEEIQADEDDEDDE
ncbi:MAG: hypothetical protein K9L30_13690 [Desulfobacterales bacterium]|nr:hypothetical protein [Desulfobacterales bacterium]